MQKIKSLPFPFLKKKGGGLYFEEFYGWDSYKYALFVIGILIVLVGVYFLAPSTRERDKQQKVSPPNPSKVSHKWRKIAYTTVFSNRIPQPVGISKWKVLKHALHATSAFLSVLPSPQEREKLRQQREEKEEKERDHKDDDDGVSNKKKKTKKKKKKKKNKKTEREGDDGLSTNNNNNEGDREKLRQQPHEPSLSVEMVEKRDSDLSASIKFV